MLMRDACLLAVFTLALGALGAPAHALTARECSAKYKEAQKAGTLGGMKWNDFRKSECAADAPAAAAQPSAAHVAVPGLLQRFFHRHARHSHRADDGSHHAGQLRVARDGCRL